MKDFIFDNGDEVQDVVTGRIGIVTGRSDYITGCNCYLLQLPVIGNEDAKSHWVDEDRLTVVQKAKVVLPNNPVGSEKENLPPVK